MSEQPLRGRFLVATPTLTDDNFAHSVVVVLEHGGEGTVGVIVNRPSDVALAAALPGWQALAAEPTLVFVGGPVQRDAIMGLARTYGSGESELEIMPGLGIVDLGEDPTLIEAPLAGVRVFAGYAGWSAGQLESEIAAGGWFVVDGRPDDVFSDDPDTLWERVLRRQGGVFRTIPADPTEN